MRSGKQFCDKSFLEILGDKILPPTKETLPGASRLLRIRRDLIVCILSTGRKKGPLSFGERELVDKTYFRCSLSPSRTSGSLIAFNCNSSATNNPRSGSSSPSLSFLSSSLSLSLRDETKSPLRACAKAASKFPLRASKKSSARARLKLNWT